jgi:putative ABC transport system permease protein
MEIVVTNSLSQGLIVGFMALGVLVTFRIMGFPDLTVEGSFPLGAAVTARLITEGVSPWAALAAAAGAGALAGITTGIINTRFKVNIILAGILTAAAIYSIMLRVMGRPNTPLLGEETLFTRVREWTGSLGRAMSSIVFVAVLVAIAVLVLWWFLHTDLGLTIRAVGSNEGMIRSLGVNTDTTKVLTMAISNALVAISGSLASQDQGFADVGMGIGALVAAVASVMLGESLFGRSSVARWLVAVIIGSILYRVLLNIGLRLGMPATDFRMVTAVLVLIVLAIPLFQAQVRGSRLAAQAQERVRVRKRRAEA